METLNDSKMNFAFVVGKVRSKRYALTTIVKGTFQLAHGQRAVLAEEQLFPTGDEPYPGADDAPGSLRYASDFAPFKPSADLLLVGNCHAQGGSAVSSAIASFRVGNQVSSVSVKGNRHWTFGLLGNRISDPEPFSEMSLQYENSFGGVGYAMNPVGKGYGKQVDEDQHMHVLLPNIEDLDHLVNHKTSRPTPAGFGPLSPDWKQRKPKSGTYNKKWQRERWPWYPEDFDWTHFNAAQPGMRMDGYLRGAEALSFENLHPEIPDYQSALPRLRIRCFVSVENWDGSDAPLSLCEIPMELDTLWIDMAAEQLVLVWRGNTPVQSEDYEDELKHAYIVSESMEEPEKPLDFYEARLSARLCELGADVEFEVESPPEVIEDEQVDAEEAKSLAELEAAEEKMTEFLENECPPLSEEAKIAEAAMLLELGLDFASVGPEPELTREKIEMMLAAGESLAGLDLSELDLAGLDFKGLNLEKTVFAGASLVGADFSEAVLTEANLGKADLSGATLCGALLGHADFTQAILSGADLTGAELVETTFNKANLENAILVSVAAQDAYFAEANLTQANLSQGKFDGADFSQSTLSAANFEGASLREAFVGGANGIAINMKGADLTGLRAAGNGDFSRGVFSQAIANESVWEEMTLTGADFSFAQLDGANFSKAGLEKSNFHAASMKNARFDRSRLCEADLTQVNLFEASLVKADFRQADLSYSNLYGAETYQARFDDARLESTNLKMTKLDT